MKIHTMRDGTQIAIADMSDIHLINAIRLMRRKASEGIVVRYGGAGCSGDDMWYDEDHLFGGDALDRMDYSAYADEAERRGLKIEEEAQ